jgi:lysyl-tRNA synthetase, class II
MSDEVQDQGQQIANTSDLRAVRLKKLEDMRAAGYDPFQKNAAQVETSVEARAMLPKDQHDGPAVKVAGRLMVIRLMGKASFAKLQDRDGLVQLYFKQQELGDAAYAFFKTLDLGDIIGVEGTLFRTKTGEETVRVKKFELVCKALRPLPDKWHGLADQEQIYRQRYLDLITSEESRKRFQTRSKIISCIRRYLDERQFMEVETPVLMAEAGGAAARPFVTHFNALDCEFYLRIALELSLKKLLVGGFDRVYEIGRTFRNEGMDRRHNPEFTMMEVYQAYSDYKGMMELVRGLVRRCCEEVLGTDKIARYDGTVIDLSGEWRVAKYRDLVREATKLPNWFELSRDEKYAWCLANGVEVSAKHEDFEITNAVYEKRVECFLIQPTFVTLLPKELIPLAKRCPDDPNTVEVFELCINGQEIAPAYSEQNDPLEQRRALEAQAGEEVQKIDEDFLTALEHGMPPAGGMGMGIDRLVILLTGAANIRDVILFPSMRPDKAAEPAKDEAPRPVA